MALFHSAREKRLWIWAALVGIAIFGSLFIGRPLIEFFGNQDTQALIFVLGMLLVGATMLMHAVRTDAKGPELSLWLGITAVYVMLFLRLGLAERSHLIEYSVMAVFVHKALLERVKHKSTSWPAAILAFLITFVIGALDEFIQFFLPHRVFDLLDILFNSFAIALAISARIALRWIRQKAIGKKKSG